MQKTKFHKIMEGRNHLYVVIAARYKNKWIFCRQKGRDTWEIPGGHIEENETANNAAKRELYEETGAKEFNIRPISDFSLELDDGSVNFSRLYYAEVFVLDSLDDFEIEEIIFEDELPKRLTHPNIQPILFEKVKEIIIKKK